jgi:hypothetical protein
MSDRISHEQVFSLPQFQEMTTGSGSFAFVGGTNVREMLVRLCNEAVESYVMNAEPTGVLVEKTCVTCKHWDRITPYEVDECTNSEVRGMIETDYAGYDFMPPADFSCNRWEAK